MVTLEVWHDHELVGLVQVPPEQVATALRRLNEGPCMARVTTFTEYGQMLALVMSKRDREQRLVRGGFPCVADDIFTTSPPPMCRLADHPDAH